MGLGIGMLSNNALLQAIKHIGTRQDFIRLLDISRQRLNGWLNDRKKMNFEYAIAIEYLTFGQVKAETLAPKQAYFLKKLGIQLTLGFGVIPLKKISIADINTENESFFEFPELYQLASSISSRGLLRPIVVDENNQLIFGMRRLQAVIFLNQKSTKVYQLNLNDIIRNVELTTELKRLFTISERTAIGLKLEAILNSKHGGLRLSRQVHKPALKQMEKSRVLIVKSIGLGSQYAYGLAKKILKQGHHQLIRAVDDNKISISYAAQLAHLPYDEQLNCLKDKLNKADNFKDNLIKITRSFAREK